MRRKVTKGTAPADSSTRRRAQLHARKDSYINHRGGVCEGCGDKLKRGLAEFHHPDPTKKDKKSKELFRGDFWRDVEELDSLEMLCTTCHRRIHDEWESAKRAEQNTKKAETLYQQVYNKEYETTEQELKCRSEQPLQKTSLEPSTPSQQTKLGQKKPKTSSMMSQQTLWEGRIEKS